MSEEVNYQRRVRWRGNDGGANQWEQSKAKETLTVRGTRLDESVGWER